MSNKVYAKTYLDLLMWNDDRFETTYCERVVVQIVFACLNPQKTKIYPIS